jgi:hypothetical protein
MFSSLSRYFHQSAIKSHLGIICAVQQISIWFEKLKRTLAEELKLILAPQQQIYKKKSASVGTKNQVESFLVILDSG